MTLAEIWFQTMHSDFPGSFSIRRGKETILAETPALIKRMSREIISFGSSDYVIEGKTLITLTKYMGEYEWKQGDSFHIGEDIYETANDTPLADGSWNGEVISIALKKMKGKK